MGYFMCYNCMMATLLEGKIEGADLLRVDEMVTEAQIALEEEIMRSSLKLHRASDIGIEKFHMGVLEASALMERVVLELLYGYNPAIVREINIRRHSAGMFVPEEYFHQKGLGTEARHMAGLRSNFHATRLEALGISQDPFAGVFR